MNQNLSVPEVEHLGSKCSNSEHCPHQLPENSETDMRRMNFIRLWRSFGLIGKREIRQVRNRRILCMAYARLTLSLCAIHAQVYRSSCRMQLTFENSSCPRFKYHRIVSAFLHSDLHFSHLQVHSNLLICQANLSSTCRLAKPSRTRWAWLRVAVSKHPYMVN